MACLAVLFSSAGIAAGADDSQSKNILQPQGLEHTGVYALREMDPNLTGAGVKFAVISRSYTYIDNEPQNAQEYDPEVSNGIFIYGEEGTVFVTDRKWIIIPKGQDKQHEVNEVPADMATEHMAEFLQAVQSRKQPLCTTEEGYISTATVKLAMIAYDVESKITWDQESQTITGNPKAAELLKREYRQPWKHPYNG